MSDEVREIAAELRRHLAWQESDGTRTIQDEAGKKPASVARPPAHAERAPTHPERAPTHPERAPTHPERAPTHPERSRGTEPSPGPAPALRTLDEIRREIGDCKRCKLCSTRKNIVYGSGNPRAELVFVGEGPGEQEDIQGQPFVGPAGQLLTKMIEAMKFSRDTVYICNVVKCRPPGNRNPEPDEIAACEPFLKAQLHSIQPKVIVALGKFAAQTLLRDATPITRLRGQWKKYEGIPLMPTYHPAYLLRQPDEKKVAWMDLQEVMRKFGKK